MKLLLCGKHAKSILFFLKLLKKPDIVSQISDCDENITHILNLELIQKESGYYITNSLFNQYIQNVNIQTINGYDITIDCNQDLYLLYKQIFNLVYPSVLYETQHPNTIEWSIRLVLNRSYTPVEMKYHITNNKKKNINMPEWLLILYLCPESSSIMSEALFESIKQPKLAVIFCGHVRSYKYTIQSQKILINNPNIDVFIHTWDDYGYKNDRRTIKNQWLNAHSGLIDPESIKLHYQPKKIKIENNKSVSASLSLIDKINPIFLFAYQARDDASKYINSQLYSIYQAYKLVEEYEQEQGFKYDGILKLRFDFNIKNINIPNVFRQISQDSTLWFAHPKLCGHGHHGGGGGCVSCDNNIEHTDHTNDICDILFYGCRESAAKTCELFLHSENILRTHIESNKCMLQKYPKTRHQIIDNFIYIETFDDIENKFVCYYPEGLLRRHLKDTRCLSSREISGNIK